MPSEGNHIQASIEPRTTELYHNAALVSSNPSAFAKTVKVEGSGQGTTLTANFSFDGVASALSIISTGKDNVGGDFNE